ncbi:MAG TPA: hypothetical protein VFI95_13555 [Terriglobales bacterium]|nr:hypothetical protein [Terriglobales bacterium]
MVRSRAIVLVLCSVLFCCFASAESDMPPAATALLNHLTGTWILQGTIAGKQKTHDVQAEWVLDHEYVQLHEVSRDKNSTGGTAYEAIVYIGWDAKTDQYTCLWLDNTAGSGLAPEGIAHGKLTGDSIPFIFTLSASDQTHNTFTYDKAADSWQWVIDNIANGQTQPFAKLRLNRVR